MRSSSSLDTRRVHPYVVRAIHQERVNNIKCEWHTAKIKRNAKGEVVSVTQKKSR